MKGIIDTHSHLYAAQFEDDLEQTISRAKSAGVEKILLPNIDQSSLKGMASLVKDYPGFFYRMSGLHPCSVKDDFEQELQSVKKELSKPDNIAVGEIGIDLHWDKSTLDIQTQAFVQQCDWAIEYNLPIVIHSRESIDIIIDIIESGYKNKLSGVFHCFTGTKEQASKIIDLNFLMGIGGVVTFKNSPLRDELKGFDLQHFVIETDAPYLAPKPYRGKRNEPAYITEVVKELSLVFDVDEQEVVNRTRENALNLFNL